MSGIGGSVEQMTQGHLRNVQQLAVFYTPDFRDKAHKYYKMSKICF